MRLKKVMLLISKAKCSPTALMDQKQCSERIFSALHCGQVHENKRESVITALTALNSAVRLHFVSKNNGFPSYARARVLSNDKRRCAARPVGRALALGVVG